MLCYVVPSRCHQSEVTILPLLDAGRQVVDSGNMTSILSCSVQEYYLDTICLCIRHLSLCLLTAKIIIVSCLWCTLMYETAKDHHQIGSHLHRRPAICRLQSVNDTTAIYSTDKSLQIAKQYLLFSFNLHRKWIMLFDSTEVIRVL